MNFMESYKRLDNLCRTFEDYPQGISSYIELMDHCGQLRFQCNSWDQDYYLLKTYRHARNQIVHESGVYEEDLCDEEDVEWLQTFYVRLLNQEDPLGKYFKAQKESQKRRARPEELRQTEQPSVKKRVLHDDPIYRKEPTVPTRQRPSVPIRPDFSDQKQSYRPASNHDTIASRIGFAVLGILFLIILYWLCSA